MSNHARPQYGVPSWRPVHKARRRHRIALRRRKAAKR